jgi:cystinosin
VRRSASGVSLAYVAWNCLGFACYSIFTATLFWSEPVREEYRAAHNGIDSDVRSNDVFFALHAFGMTLVNAGQAFFYGSGGQTLSVLAAGGVGCAVAYVVTYAKLWAAGHCGCVSALQLLNALAAVKVCTTAVKYLPQIALHARTRSTAGFSSANALTDAAGGALSLAQLLLDASPWVYNDATLITGDLPKLGLALLSMCYSSILIGQHLVYGDGPDGGGRDGVGVLADGDDSDGGGGGGGRRAPLLG